jgi:hypothetical protein
MEYIYIVIRQIGDLKTNIRAFSSKDEAHKYANRVKEETHTEGYTDFKFPVEPMQIY